MALFVISECWEVPMYVQNAKLKSLFLLFSVGSDIKLSLALKLSLKNISKERVAFTNSVCYMKVI